MAERPVIVNQCVKPLWIRSKHAGLVDIRTFWRLEVRERPAEHPQIVYGKFELVGHIKHREPVALHDPLMSTGVIIGVCLQRNTAEAWVNEILFALGNDKRTVNLDTV